MFELISIGLITALVSVMATKLFWHTVYHTVADGTTLGNNGARYRNETGDDVHVIIIERAAQLTAAAPGEDATFQLSTQNTYNNTGDGETEFRKSMNVSAGATGATPSDGDFAKEDVLKYLRGQVTLENGEALYSSINKSSGGAAIIRYQLGLEIE